MKIAIITAHLAHYRRHLYKILDHTSSVEITHYSGGPSKKGIRSLDPNDVRHLKSLRNLEFQNLVWQQRIVPMALRAEHDAYIFTGDVKYLSTWVASLILKMKGKDVFFWTIGWHRPERGLKNFIRLTFYKLSDALLLYGERERDLAIKQGFPKEKIHVVYNSVSEIPDIEVSPVTAKRESVIGVLARLTPQKNIGLLIEAAALLAKQGQNVKVIIGGDGSERNSLQKQAESRGVNCEFLGAIHDAEVIDDFYRKIDITVIPAAAGLTTIQSLSYGVPVITNDDEETQGPESRAIIEGKTGSRYTAGSVQVLAEKILTWMENVRTDPTCVAKECQAEVRKHWSPEIQASRMLEAVRGPVATGVHSGLQP